MPRRLLAFLLLLLTVFGVCLGPAEAGESRWYQAPVLPEERPTVPSPPGGWWLEDGQYVRTFGAWQDHETVRRLADHAAVAVPRLSRRLGVPSGEAIDVYLVPTQDAFMQVQPGTPPPWADGTAWASLGLVFLKAPAARVTQAKPLEQVLDHELVHVLLGRAFAPRVPPRWFQEGLAQFYAGEVGLVGGRSLLVVEGEVPELWQLRGYFAEHSPSAELAYAASADFFGWMAATYGERAIRETIAGLAAGDDLDTALTTATGQDAKALGDAWHARWEDPLMRIVRAVNLNLVFGIGALALVYGAWRRRRRAQSRLARWEQEEEAARAILRARTVSFPHPVPPIDLVVDRRTPPPFH